MAVEVIALVLGGEEFGTEMPDGAVFLSPVFLTYQVFFTDQAVFLPTTVYRPSRPQAVLLVDYYYR
jgi:hypothetical protein